MTTIRTQTPRLCSGLSIVPAGETIVIDGAPRRRRMSGTTATSLLPRALPLLDGTRDEAAIAGELGAEATAVAGLIDVLDESGLLEWPPADPSPVPLSAGSHVTTYLSRNISHFSGYRCTEDVQHTLAGATVVLVGADPAVSQIASDLAETGVGTVRSYATPDAVSAAGRRDLTAAGLGLAVVLDDDRGPALAEMVARVGDRTPVLRFSSADDAIEIGPLFCEGCTACVACFRAGYRDLSDAAAPSAVRPPLTGLRYAAWLGLAASLVTSHVLALLTRTATAGRPWCLTRITGSGRQTDRFDVLAEMGCRSCGTADAGLGEVALALAYERQQEIRPAQLMPADVASRERLRYIRSLELERNCPLPAPSRPLGKDVIGALLARAAGVRVPARADQGPDEAIGHAGTLDRWPPSAGNLASVQLYLATQRNVFGLPGTIFRYEDLSHRVTAVRADEIPLASLLAGTDLVTSSFDLVIVFVAAIARIARKYGDLALRLACLDAGCAALQLSVAAADRQVDVVFASAWPTGLSKLLELEEDAELITAVAGVRGPALARHPEGR